MKSCNLWFVAIYFMLIPTFTTGQNKIFDAPKKKDFQKENHYKYWKKAIQDSNLAINDPDEVWTFKGSMHRWNRFLGVYNLWPENPDYLFTVFTEAIEYEPHSFCASYQKDFRRFLSYLDNSIPYYSRQIYQMDSVCNEVLDYNENLVEILKNVDERDIRYRGKKLMLPNDPDWPKQIKLDSINLATIELLIDSIGYLGRNQVGVDYEDAMWIVVQHSNLKSMEKFLPVIKKNVDTRNLSPVAYAYMYDRICLLKDIPQLYGTQDIWNEVLEEYHPYKLDKPSTVNERRYNYGVMRLKGYPKYEPVLDGK